MTTLRRWFDEFSADTGEQITSISLCPLGDFRETVEAQPIPFAEVSDGELDRLFNDGWGAPECQLFCAWSETWVMFPTQYDGAESWEKVPRNPMAHIPVQPT